MRPFNLLLIILIIGFIACTPTKIAVKNIDDLPKYLYTLEDQKAINYMEDKGLIQRLARQVEKDLKSDLKKYDIQDKATLKDYYEDLELIAIINEEYNEALKAVKKQRFYATKEVNKYWSGFYSEMIAKTKLSGNVSNKADFEVALEKNIDLALMEMPYDLIEERLEGELGQVSILTKNLFLGVLESNMQPKIDVAKKEVSQDLAVRLLSFHVGLINLEYFPIYAKCFQAYYDKNHKEEIEKKDIWVEREIVLEKQENLNPVVLGVWDSGVDTDIFKKDNLWVNTAEKLDGKDTDGNGFVDDINGIGYDLMDQKTSSLLAPIDENIKDVAKMRRLSKGFRDLNAAVKSDEVKELKETLGKLEPKEVNGFVEDLNYFGSYQHGTHVAGIMAKDNPFAKLLTVRITFEHKTISTPPTLESVEQQAINLKETIEYFQKNKVRVVNMSWLSTKRGIEHSLRENGVGESEEELLALAEKLFMISRNAIYEAMKNAPEILFVCAAGNGNNDVDFSGGYPNTLGLPNLLVVGAVDQEGKVTSFTTMGKSVDIYANGYEVESYVPGGAIQKSSGTSMASPNVANLAGKLLAKYPELNVQELKGLILNGAVPSKENEAVLLLHPKRSLEMADKKK